MQNQFCHRIFRNSYRYSISSTLRVSSQRLWLDGPGRDPGFPVFALRQGLMQSRHVDGGFFWIFHCRPDADSCGITAVGALESMHAVCQNGITTGRLDRNCFWIFIYSFLVSDVLTNWELRTKTICSLSIDAPCEDTFDAKSSFHNC